MDVPIIEFKKENCVNCHACITVCPAKFCNDGSKQIVAIDHERCVGCGTCIAACKHDARVGEMISKNFSMHFYKSNHSRCHTAGAHTAGAHSRCQARMEEVGCTAGARHEWKK